MARDFRTKESLEEEAETRAMLRIFLEERGFTQIVERRISNGQTIDCIDPQGLPISMRVKLCWRYDRDGKSSDYSGAQILGKVKDDDWVAAIQKFADRRKTEGSSHILFIQREGVGFRYAAKIPIDSLASIWDEQRAESDRLNAQDRRAERKANQAKNGKSPTLWLEDTRGGSIAEILWEFSGVEDLTDLELKVGLERHRLAQQDPLGFDPDLYGRDVGERVLREVWGIKRDTAVRRKVIERSKGACENCQKQASYEGFLDVHHILGAAKSDREWTCVALCPNCHRDAHASPKAALINERLLAYAEQFRS